jgi:hypothetical protein
MRKSPGEIDRHIAQVCHAWESMCRDQPFAELTRDQFMQEVQSCKDANAKFAAIDTEWTATRKERNEAYEAVRRVIQRVVSAVKAHPKYGEDSSLYAAMGYVPKSERGSGLTRKREAGGAKEEGATEAS